MKNKNIRTKIISNFFIVILITILVFELAVIHFVHYFYYSSMEGILTNEIKLSADLFEAYLNDDLNNIVLQDYDVFYKRTEAQVQLMDNTGIVLMDSIGSSDLGKKLESEDIISAQNGNMGKCIYKRNFNNINVMSLSAPLKSRGQQIGIIRLSVSLEKIDAVIQSIIIKLIIFGIAVSLLSLLLSSLMSLSIVKPLRKLTLIAHQIAEGNFHIKAKVDRSDEIGELARTINFMTENIQKKEQIKNDFISSISHELRTPLTSIKGWAITLQSEDYGMNQLMSDGLDIIEKESDRLSGMVEELLDFSRFVSGRITLQKEPLNLVSLAKSLSTQFKIRANNEKIDLIVNYDRDPIMILADKNRIKQVLINFLDNALKFTESGGTVVINILDVGEEVTLEVIDTGIGITQEEIELVTERFYKGSNSHSHTGLGLSISEEIVELHGGYMEIKSREGEGTSFKVILPKGGLFRE